MCYVDYKKVTWRVIPTATPEVIRHCSKCNRKMPFYCSEKFRMNGNNTRIDVWIIYKCTKCDTTLKLTIMKGIKPHDIPREMFDQFTYNDAALAWRYAFDRDFMKRNACVVDCSGVGYRVEGFDPRDLEQPLHVHLRSEYVFELKLGTLLAGVMSISVGKLRGIIKEGLITTDPPCDIVKHRIKTDLELFIRPTAISF
ncbi:MAG: DUF1062 domain-containing protein [Defluviitaleaceae bacterium]|nr:DUF1062 domain-containing protein [Defluviitaleaceae bacterium]